MKDISKQIDNYVDSITPKLNEYAVELAKLGKSFILQLGFGSVEFNFERKPNKEESEEVNKSEIIVDIKGMDYVKTLTGIMGKTYEYAKKFINKVETGKAHSKETYADMKNLVNEIDELLSKK